MPRTKELTYTYSDLAPVDLSPVIGEMLSLNPPGYPSALYWVKRGVYFRQHGATQMAAVRNGEVIFVAPFEPPSRPTMPASGMVAGSIFDADRRGYCLDWVRQHSDGILEVLQRLNPETFAGENFLELDGARKFHVREIARSLTIPHVNTRYAAALERLQAAHPDLMAKLRLKYNVDPYLHDIQTVISYQTTPMEYERQVDGEVVFRRLTGEVGHVGYNGATINVFVKRKGPFDGLTWYHDVGYFELPFEEFLSPVPFGKKEFFLIGGGRTPTFEVDPTDINEILAKLDELSQ